jgi:PmbA protein
MEKLMDIARKVADKVEVYSETGSSTGVSFENSRLKDIESSMRSGVGLLLLKGGKLGYAYTRNLIDRENLVRNALASIKGGVEADYELPLTEGLPELDTYDAGIEELSSTKMVDECERICGEFAGRTEGQLNVSAGRDTVAVQRGEPGLRPQYVQRVAQGSETGDREDARVVFA